VLPTALRVITRPFAVAMRSSVISTVHGPGDREAGGVRVMVPLSRVVTTASGRVEIELRAALALVARPTIIDESKTPIRMMATTLVFIRLLSIFLVSVRGCDTHNNFRVSCGN
jgi:hypothetical protein